VCGRVRGYQVGYPSAFGPYENDRDNLDLFVDGVLISHSMTQKYIWAYVTGFQRQLFNERINSCSDYRYNGTVPQFIGNDYYCDSGVDSNP